MKQQAQNPHRCAVGLLSVFSLSSLYSYKTPNSGSGWVSHSFACSWDSVPHLQLLCTSLIWGFLPFLKVSYFVLCVHSPLVNFSSEKEREGEWIWERSEEGGNEEKWRKLKLWLVDTYCMREESIFNNKRPRVTFVYKSKYSYVKGSLELFQLNKNGIW